MGLVKGNGEKQVNVDYTATEKKVLNACSNKPAIEKLKPTPQPKSSGRDYDAEARGKVACAAYTAAIASPAIASFSKDEEDFKKKVHEYAQLAIEATWKAQRGE